MLCFDLTWLHYIRDRTFADCPFHLIRCMLAFHQWGVSARFGAMILAIAYFIFAVDGYVRLTDTFLSHRLT